MLSILFYVVAWEWLFSLLRLFVIGFTAKNTQIIEGTVKFHILIITIITGVAGQLEASQHVQGLNEFNEKVTSSIVSHASSSSEVQKLCVVSSLFDLTMHELANRDIFTEIVNWRSFKKCIAGRSEAAQAAVIETHLTKNPIMRDILCLPGAEQAMVLGLLNYVKQNKIIMDFLDKPDVWKFDGYVHAVSWSLDGTCIAVAFGSSLVGDGIHVVQIIDAGTGKVLVTLKEQHSHVVKALSFSPDGRQIASASYDGKVCISAVITGDLLHSLNGIYVVLSLSWLFDGTCIVLNSFHNMVHMNMVHMWDVVKKKLLGKLEGHKKPVIAASCSPDSRYIVSSASGGAVFIWDAINKKLLHTLDLSDGIAYTHHSIQGAVEVCAVSVCWSASGDHIACGMKNGMIRVWDVIGEKWVCALIVNTINVNAVSFLPNGRQIVSVSPGRTIRVWDLVDRQEVRKLTGHEGMINSISLSPQGNYVVSGSDYETVRISRILPIDISDEILALNFDQIEVVEKIIKERGTASLTAQEWIVFGTLSKVWQVLLKDRFLSNSGSSGINTALSIARTSGASGVGVGIGNNRSKSE